MFYRYYRTYYRTARYTEPPVLIQLDTTNLPLVIINTDGKASRITRRNEVKAKLVIIDNGEGELNYTDTVSHPNQMIDFEGKAKIHLSGYTSLEVPKKSFTVEIIDEKGEKQKTKILGMKKSSKWGLRASYIDGSMMRDILTMELAQGNIDYASQMQLCEVMIDGIYQGVYLLTEKVTRDRLGIKKTSPEDEELSGGYLLEKDHLDCTFRSKYPPVDSTGQAISDVKTAISVVYPKEKNLKPNQLQQIENEFAAAEDAIASGDFTRYSKFIDVDNFVHYFLINEFASNSDSYRMSFKIYKPKGEERYLLAPWDFDYAYGNASRDRSFINTWWYEGRFTYKLSEEYPIFWFYTLMKDSVFRSRVQEQWGELRENAYSTANIEHKIDSLNYVLTVNGAINRNTEAWETYSVHRKEARRGLSYNEEIAFLKAWIRARLAFMDRELLGIDNEEDIQKAYNDVGRLILIGKQKY